MYILQLEAVSLGEKSISVMLELIHFIDKLPLPPQRVTLVKIIIVISTLVERVDVNIETVS